MDLALWTQLEPSGKIQPEEFFRPDRMSARLVQAVGITRQTIGRPMRMSRSRDGKVYHPSGDACAYEDGHAAFSLHYFGIDHDGSKAANTAILDPAQDGLAVDFDFAVADPNLLFELYLQLERVRLPFAPWRWMGIGAYPHWQLGRKTNPGFHVDLRSLDHPDAGARWMRDAGGTYIPLTWRNWRREFGISVG